MCSHGSHWETNVHVQVKTVDNSEFFMIAMISLLPLTSSSQKEGNTGALIWDFGQASPLLVKHNQKSQDQIIKVATQIYWPL